MHLISSHCVSCASLRLTRQFWTLAIVATGLSEELRKREGEGVGAARAVGRAVAGLPAGLSAKKTSSLRSLAFCQIAFDGEMSTDERD